MPEQETYRNDLPFNTDSVSKLRRTTLNLADNFNEIFEQILSNEQRLMEAIQWKEDEHGNLIPKAGE